MGDYYSKPHGAGGAPGGGPGGGGGLQNGQPPPGGSKPNDGGQGPPPSGAGGGGGYHTGPGQGGQDSGGGGHRLDPGAVSIRGVVPSSHHGIRLPQGPPDQQMRRPETMQQPRTAVEFLVAGSATPGYRAYEQHPGVVPPTLDHYQSHHQQSTAPPGQQSGQQRLGVPPQQPPQSSQHHQAASQLHTAVATIHQQQQQQQQHVAPPQQSRRMQLMPQASRSRQRLNNPTYPTGSGAGGGNTGGGGVGGGVGNVNRLMCQQRGGSGGGGMVGGRSSAMGGDMRSEVAQSHRMDQSGGGGGWHKEPAYHPQVEAISPAPEEVNVDDSLLREKDEIGRKLAEIETEIQNREGQYRKAIDRQDQLLARVRKPSGGVSRQESTSEIAENMFRNFANPIQGVIADNRRKAKEQHKVLARLCGAHISPGPLTLPLYRQPSDLPNIVDLERNFRLGFKSKLLQYVRRRKLAGKARVEKLSREYETLSKLWCKKLEKVHNSSKRRQKDAKMRDCFEKTFPEIRKNREDRDRLFESNPAGADVSGGAGSTSSGCGGASTSAGVGAVSASITSGGGGSTCPVLTSSAGGGGGGLGSAASADGSVSGPGSMDGDNMPADPAEEMRKMKEYGIEPPLQLPPWSRKYHFIDSTGLLRDPKTQHRVAQDYNSRWSKEERDIFKERFIQHHKNFLMIASYLEKKSPSDCVQFYYLSKKKENYKQLVKKHNARRRRVQAERQQQRSDNDTSTTAGSTATNNSGPTTSSGGVDTSSSSANHESGDGSVAGGVFAIRRRAEGAASSSASSAGVTGVAGGDSNTVEITNTEMIKSESPSSGANRQVMDTPGSQQMVTSVKRELSDSGPLTGGTETPGGGSSSHSHFRQTPTTGMGVAAEDDEPKRKIRRVQPPGPGGDEEVRGGSSKSYGGGVKLEDTPRTGHYQHHQMLIQHQQQHHPGVMEAGARSASVGASLSRPQSQSLIGQQPGQQMLPGQQGREGGSTDFIRDLIAMAIEKNFNQPTLAEANNFYDNSGVGGVNISLPSRVMPGIPSTMGGGIMPRDSVSAPGLGRRGPSTPTSMGAGVGAPGVSHTSQSRSPRNGKSPYGDAMNVSLPDTLPLGGESHGQQQRLLTEPISPQPLRPPPLSSTSSSSVGGVLAKPEPGGGHHQVTGPPPQLGVQIPMPLGWARPDTVAIGANPQDAQGFPPRFRPAFNPAQLPMVALSSSGMVNVLGGAGGYPPGTGGPISVHTASHMSAAAAAAGGGSVGPSGGVAGGGGGVSSSPADPFTYNKDILMGDFFTAKQMPRSSLQQQQQQIVTSQHQQVVTSQHQQAAAAAVAAAQAAQVSSQSPVAVAAAMGIRPVLDTATAVAVAAAQLYSQGRSIDPSHLPVVGGGPPQPPSSGSHGPGHMHSGGGGGESGLPQDNWLGQLNQGQDLPSVEDAQLANYISKASHLYQEEVESYRRFRDRSDSQRTRTSSEASQLMAAVQATRKNKGMQAQMIAAAAAAAAAGGAGLVNSGPHPPGMHDNIQDRSGMSSVCRAEMPPPSSTQKPLSAFSSLMAGGGGGGPIIPPPVSSGGGGPIQQLDFRKRGYTDSQLMLRPGGGNRIPGNNPSLGLTGPQQMQSIDQPSGSGGNKRNPNSQCSSPQPSRQLGPPGASDKDASGSPLTAASIIDAIIVKQISQNTDIEEAIIKPSGTLFGLSQELPPNSQFLKVAGSSSSSGKKLQVQQQSQQQQASMTPHLIQASASPRKTPSPAQHPSAPSSSSGTNGGNGGVQAPPGGSSQAAGNSKITLGDHIYKVIHEDYRHPVSSSSRSGSAAGSPSKGASSQHGVGSPEDRATASVISLKHKVLAQALVQPLGARGSDESTDRNRSSREDLSGVDTKSRPHSRDAGASNPATGPGGGSGGMEEGRYQSLQQHLKMQDSSLAPTLTKQHSSDPSLSSRDESSEPLSSASVTTTPTVSHVPPPVCSVPLKKRARTAGDSNVNAGTPASSSTASTFPPPPITASTAIPPYPPSSASSTSRSPGRAVSPALSSPGGLQIDLESGGSSGTCGSRGATVGAKSLALPVSVGGSGGSTGGTSGGHEEPSKEDK